MRDVDFAVLAGEAQRIPFLARAAIFSAPGLADDVARNVVAELVLDLAELLHRADICFLVELAQGRTPRILAAVNAPLRHLPGMLGVHVLGPVDAAADEDAALAVEHRHADARPLWPAFITAPP